MDESLRKYIGIVWHWAWLIGLMTLLAGGAAYTAARLTPPLYEAATTLLVNEAPSDAGKDTAAILIKSDRLARTYADMMTQQPVLDEVIATLGLNDDAEALGKRVAVTPIRDTQLLRLTVEDHDPALAAQVANMLPQVFSRRNAELQAVRYADAKANLTGQRDAAASQIAAKQAELDAVTRSTEAHKEADLIRLQSELVQLRQVYDRLVESYENIRLAESQSTSNIVITEPATPPEEPVRPRSLRDTALGAILGLLLALGVVFLIEYLDNSIRSPEQIETALQLPVIGLITRTNLPRTKGSTTPGVSAAAELIAIREPRSPVTEAFRALRTNIQIAGIDRPIRTLLVTSAGPDEGKSVVAANLAVVMAQAGREVVLLDADLRRPRVAQLFSQHDYAGLPATLLDDSAQWPQTLMPTAVDNLMTVPAGNPPPNPSELLGSRRMQEFLTVLGEHCTTIVIDSPPLLAVADALVLAPQMDGAVVVVQYGRTHLRAAQQAVSQLQQAGARVLGVVLNQVPIGRRGYGYGYGYYTQYRGYYSPADGDGDSQGGAGGNGQVGPRTGQPRHNPAAHLREARLEQGVKG